MSRIQVFALGFVSALVLVVVALRGPSVTTPAATGPLIPALAPQQPDGEPAPGMFLVATRDLMDPWFGQSVVLLLDHGEGGSVGLIVNRRFRATLSDAIPDLEQPEADIRSPRRPLEQPTEGVSSHGSPARARSRARHRQPALRGISRP